MRADLSWLTVQQLHEGARKKQFEAYLPFAMALSVDKQWAGAFERIYSEAATRSRGWYVGRHGSTTFSPSHLVSDLSSVSDRTSSAMVSNCSTLTSSYWRPGPGYSMRATRPPLRSMIRHSSTSRT